MPELPEVETIANALHAKLQGQTIDSAKVLRTDVIQTQASRFSRDLVGQPVHQVFRQGKRIVFVLGHRMAMVVHLGMTGRLTIHEATDPLAPHTHIRFGYGGVELRFVDPRRFGGVWLLTDDATITGRQLGKLGEDPLFVGQKDFSRLLDRRRQVKSILMDQSVIGGIGNIYCDESLHDAGIHPRRMGSSLDHEESKKLLRSIRSILKRAIRFRGTTFMDYRSPDGAKGSFQRYHRVYHRSGKPCRGCGAVIVRIIVNGRSTFVCPMCQPEIAAEDSGGLRIVSARS